MRRPVAQTIGIGQLQQSHVLGVHSHKIINLSEKRGRKGTRKSARSMLQGPCTLAALICSVADPGTVFIIQIGRVDPAGGQRLYAPQVHQTV
jgi:hypothetical protein